MDIEAEKLRAAVRGGLEGGQKVLIKATHVLS